MARKTKTKSKTKKASKKKSTTKKKVASKPGASKKKSASKKPAAPRARAPSPTAPAAATPLAAAATGVADVVPIPPRDTFNRGLHSASESTMLALLGVPGRKTKDCSDATGDFASRIKHGINVGPLRVSGLDVAVEALKAVFDDAKRTIPDVVAAVKTAGMLCVRHKRTNPDSFSNHSWGAAIDLFFGSRVVAQGAPETHRGMIQLAPFFNRHGWFWGAGFSGSAVDSMHFELAEETIRAAVGPGPGV